MHSELLRIPYDWGGVPIFGVGVLLVVWAIAGVVTLAAMVRRHGWNAETWSVVPLLALVGAAIVFLPQLFPGGLPIRGYGSMVLVGAASGVGLAVHRARQVGLNHELILSLAFWMFICGIVAARLFYVIEYWDQRFAGLSPRDTLFEVLNFPQGGLVVYGALVGAAAAFVVFTGRHKLPLLATADLVAPSLVVGLAFGRIGCLLNGCCYGGPTDVPWAVTFPPGSPPYQDQLARGEFLGFRLEANHAGRPRVANVDDDSPAAAAGVAEGDVVSSVNGRPVPELRLTEQALAEALAARQPIRLGLSGGRPAEFPALDLPARSRPVHPTQIYSAAGAGLIAVLLWWYYPRRRRDGEVIALLLTIYPVARFLLEIVRVDEPAVFGTGMSISQNISILVFVGVLGLWWYLLRGPRRVTDWSRVGRR